MHKGRGSFGVTLWFALCVGCAGDPNGTNAGGRFDNSPVAPKAGTSGGATADMLGSAGFGNSGTMIHAPPPRPIQDGGQVSDGSVCEIGKFCPSNNPDLGCGSITLGATIKMKPGNLLIIFDQSMSMEEPWMNTTKRAAARMALVQAITPLQDLLHVGAIFLPDPNVACIFEDPQMTPAVQPIEGVGNIPFQPGPMFLTAFMNHASMEGRGIGTPLNEAFDRADVAIQAALTALNNMTTSPVGDLAPGPLAVLVFTDGQPNCPPLPNGGGGMQCGSSGCGASSPLPTVTGIPTKTEPEHASDWFAQSVPTYMIGLPGAMDGMTLLNAIAASGSGGMNMTYIDPADPMTLAAKLMELAQRQVGFDSCSADLMPPTGEPEKLQLVVEEANMPGVQEAVPHDLGSAGGWMVSDDGAHVELTGGVCESAKDGKFSKLTFTYGCADVPPIPMEHVM